MPSIAITSPDLVVSLECISDYPWLLKWAVAHINICIYA